MNIIYFSATGNSKYVTESIGHKLNCSTYNIEDERTDFKQLFESYDDFLFIYPIHGSTVATPMQYFVARYYEVITNKRISVIVTQALFSGDGARAMTDLLDDSNECVYAKHLRAPSNISNANLNLPILKTKDKVSIKRFQSNFDEKIEVVANELVEGINKLVGFNKFSILLGKIQNTSFPKVIEEASSNFDVNHETCIVCNKCVRNCPVENIINSDGLILGTGKCVSCYRCINECPSNSISVFFKKHRKANLQYHGMRCKKK